MGFLEAVYEIGKTLTEADIADTSQWEDIDSFLELPPSFKSGEQQHIIRIWLDVEDPMSIPLNVKGIADIDLGKWRIEGDDYQEVKRRALFKRRTSGNAKWSFSPIFYEFQKLNNEQREQILQQTQWNSDHSTIPYLLYERILEDMEKEGAFSKGSAELIVQQLFEQRKKICDLWIIPSQQYCIVFGCQQGERFLYPGEIPAFISYFKSKLHKKMGGGKSIPCVYCGNTDSFSTSLSDVFKFATFDKPNFLPGIPNSSKQKKMVKTKSFAICRRCNSIFAKGIGFIREHSSRKNIINNVAVDVIPELVFGKTTYFDDVNELRDFMKEPLRNGEDEDVVFSFCANQGDSLVWHFVFWAKNQSQERIFLIVEDVAPTRLRKLEELWQQSLQAVGMWRTDTTNNITLDAAIKHIIWAHQDLAGIQRRKNNKLTEEQQYQMGKCFDLIGSLLSGGKINILNLKQNIVSRLPKICSPDGISSVSSYRRTRLFLIVDFLSRVNKCKG